MNNNYVAIMAGGIGSRFWPASRTARPKQFLDILGTGKSLIRMTFERFLKLIPKENIFIVTNKIYTDLVKEHLPELEDHQILGEPSRNNTAPCIAYTALKLQNINPAANMIVAPSDHIILDEQEFLATIEKGLSFTANNDALLTLGIQPTRPDTGYGYIRYQKETDSEGSRKVYKVVQFTEKPPLEKAQEYLASGDYVWNAGIFIWTVENVLNAFRSNEPEIIDILEAEGVYNTPVEQAFIDENYPKTPSISIDYAIMERAANVYTIPSSFGWSDLGTWASLFAELEKDEQQNVFTSGHVLANDVQNTLIRAPKNKLVVVKGLKDYIVVDEEDVLLIYPKSKEQEVKKITGEVKDRFDEKFS